MTATSLLPLHTDRPDREGRDRLEILSALINGPSFDPLYRADIIQIPPEHPVYSWACLVNGCERWRTSTRDLCSVHNEQWRVERARGGTKGEFLRTARPLALAERAHEITCRICLVRPAQSAGTHLCYRHQRRWHAHRTAHGVDTGFDQWLGDQEPLTGYGRCQVVVCRDLAHAPTGLCVWHEERYRSHGSPGGVSLPEQWWSRYEQNGRPVPVAYVDLAEFRRWCATATPVPRPGQINLLGLRPLAKAEVQWSLFAHAQQQRAKWELPWVQDLINSCRGHELSSLTDLSIGGERRSTGLVAREMSNTLRLVYFAPADTREAGFIETEHFGIRIPHRRGHFDLTGVSQRWLRDLLWDYLAALMRSPQCPRSRSPFDQIRRAITELSAFLEVDAPGGGHDPSLLREEHMTRFVADQRHRERNGLPSLVMKRADGTPSIVTTNTRRPVFNYTRKLLREALESGQVHDLGLGHAFVAAMPAAGGEAPRPSRRPFPDDVARALADESNLAQLAETYDPLDQGMRDIWETIIITGRRSGEVLKVPLDCIGRYGGLAMFWHDQTKVGNYDVAIRIPDYLYKVLAERQRKTLARFAARHGRQPTRSERTRMALFPTRVRNLGGEESLTYSWFHRGFRRWLGQLDLGQYVPHQARHTLATSLLRAGATLTHIRRYLGQVSDRMAEHYVHLTSSDLEDVLQRVWVAGPGTAQPGELLAGEATPLTREQAQAMAIDLSRRSTPAEGGFCTFQPVVDGGACPWNLDCHNCDKFVLSGADLLYWRRKREQWRLLAEGAPDDATADYLHQYFEPTARAIDGLEKALSGLGLLDDALALDLRKPQDYFHRVWSTAFRATDLAAGHDEGEYSDEYTTADDEEARR
ncbi:site-specific integrase [Streptomyces europaeiscabiei]|uniref:tyrosine-type recombinase/integrase n=1 Tax=Streptomyces europaeiscabiei TaxID=146819 RepID=UPI002E257B7F|nr:site-specific integrase [Streptomyces europaeiscabiei]